MDVREKQGKKSIEIFCCYTRKDRQFVDDLKAHLSPLERRKNITLWSDKDIYAGTEWEAEIKAHLNGSDIILLFVSADFINSEYCYSVEMQQAMRRHEQGEACVLPIILRPCRWQITPFGKLQALPKDAKPIRSWPDTDDAYLSVVEGIEEIVILLQNLEELKEEIIRASSNKDIDYLAVADVYNKLQLSPYARRIIFAPTVQLKIDWAQRKAENLQKVREAIASKSVRKIMEIDEMLLDVNKYLTDDERDILLLVRGAHWEDFDIPVWLTYQRIQSSSYRSAFIITTQEQSRFDKAKDEAQTLVQQHLRGEQRDNKKRPGVIKIAIAGKVISGQTTYFAALVHELERWSNENNKYIKLKCLTPDLRELVERDLIAPLFNHKLPLNATHPSMYGGYLPPLIYEMMLGATPALRAKTIQLMLYHGAGEDYENLFMLEHNKHLFSADALIFIIDPFSLLKIRSQIPAYLHADMQEHYPMDASFVFNSFVQFSKLVNLSIDATPIAIAVSKSDLLRSLLDPSTIASVLTPPKHGYGVRVDLKDMQTVDVEVKKFLYKYGDRLLLDDITRPLNTHLFAFSATGHNLDIITGSYPAIEPLRCLDPLFWIFHQLHLLQPA